jgi:hypothetical protein
MPRGFPLNRGGFSLIEHALVVVLAATVFAFIMGSSSVATAVRYGHNLRWALLTLLAVLSVVFGWRNRHVIPRALVAALGAFGGVALLSATWSVRPQLSVERAISFLLLVAVATFVAAGAAESQRRLELVLVGLLAAPVSAALLGLFLFVFDHSLAVQAESAYMPARLRGFGENPNTLAMLFALVLPIAVWKTVASGMRGRLFFGAIGALLYGSILLSGSRGAIFASAAGVVLFVLLCVRSVRVLVPTVVVLIAFFGATYKVAGGRPTRSVATASPASVTTATAPTTTTTPSGQTTTTTTTTPPTGNAIGPRPAETRFTVTLLPNGIGPIPFPPEENEIGFPGLYEYKPILAYGSGRVYAWLSAIRQGLARPLLGFGFGTEADVFVDRFYIFEGAFTENSFVGIFLQLGIVGVLLLLTPFVLIAAAALRAVRRSDLDRTVIAIGAGTCAAGFVIAFFQSYLYSVGNVATLTLWIVVFMALTSLVPVARGASAR